MEYTSKLTDAVIYREDYPVEGITYRDLSYIYATPHLFNLAVGAVIEIVRKSIGARYEKAESAGLVSPRIKIVAPEARGFILAASVAHTEHLGFVMARKFGKSPDGGATATYNTEYSSNCLEINPHLFSPEDEVIIIDDVLATGGTMEALKKIVKECGASVICGIALLGLKEFQNNWKKLSLDTYVGLIG